MRLFFDTNVILDALADREHGFRDSDAAHSLVDTPEVEGFPAARSGTALCSLATQALGKERTAANLTDLLDHLIGTPLGEHVLLRVLSAESSAVPRVEMPSRASALTGEVERAAWLCRMACRQAGRNGKEERDNR